MLVNALYLPIIAVFQPLLFSLINKWPILQQCRGKVTEVYCIHLLFLHRPRNTEVIVQNIRKSPYMMYSDVINMTWTPYLGMANQELHILASKAHGAPRCRVPDGTRDEACPNGRCKVTVLVGISE